MGWFWADSAVKPSTATAVAPHPMPPEGVAPPPGCPMHTDNKPSSFPPQSTSNPPPESCPVKHSSSTPPVPNQPSSSSLTLSKLNPLNYMPTLSNTRAANQARALPTTRERSSIPRGDADSNWEYPSPQQMYNAMLRKGGIDESQEDAVESMVAVHNFLNEGAWDEIRGWERRFAGGLGRGWEACRVGERRWAEQEEYRARVQGQEAGEPKLLKFMGRSKDLTPKAQMLQWMGWAWPAKYGAEPPFDRHDWYVLRNAPEGKTREVRYVIDYYSAPPEPTGEPVFYLDVRPAIDGPTAACERLMRWGGDVWYRASGADARK